MIELQLKSLTTLLSQLKMEVLGRPWMDLLQSQCLKNNWTKKHGHYCTGGFDGEKGGWLGFEGEFRARRVSFCQLNF